MSQVLIREGADPKVSGHFFKALVQVVLLFGADTWILTPRMERALSSFQHRFVRPLSGRHPKRHWGYSWGYIPLEAAIVEVVFEEIGK